MDSVDFFLGTGGVQHSGLHIQLLQSHQLILDKGYQRRYNQGDTLKSRQRLVSSGLIYTTPTTRKHVKVSTLSSLFYTLILFFSLNPQLTFSLNFSQQYSEVKSQPLRHLVPLVISAGSWQHKLFPPPVGMMRMASTLDIVAFIVGS